MTLFCIVTLSLLVAMANSGASDKVFYDVNNARPLFEDFIKEHSRVYKDEADKETHFKAFVENLKKINDLNAKDSSATFGINKFADYTPEESKNMFGLRLPKKD